MPRTRTYKYRNPHSDIVFGIGLAAVLLAALVVFLVSLL
jgi:hypothetical protein